MPSRRSAARLTPLADDPEAAVRLANQAIEHAARLAVPAQDPAPRAAHIAGRIRAGSVEGRIYRVGPTSVGVVLWDDEGGPAPGRHVQVLHVAAPSDLDEEYARLLDLAQAEVGPLLFLPAGLAGLTPDAEARVARARGFVRFARSEMRYPAGTAPPELKVPPGLKLRTIRPDDEPAVASVHAAAFGPSFDFYLFQRATDPKQNSAIEVHDMMSGRWGEFLPWASFLAEPEGGRPCGACLFVRAPYGPLLISLAVDPAAGGRGVGRALTSAAVRVLRERGETVIALNVTEGNLRAVALYEHLGFVRSIGPEWSWYSAELVPVAPDGRPSRPTPPPESARPGSRDDAAPRTRRA